MEFDKDLLYRLVGEKIRRARQGKMSQEKLASRLQKNRVSIVNIESGRQHAPLHVLWRIAEELETELETLIPSQTELDQASDTNDELTDEELKMIEDAAAGNPNARRQLRNVIKQGKEQARKRP